MPLTLPFPLFPRVSFLNNRIRYIPLFFFFPFLFFLSFSFVSYLLSFSPRLPPVDSFSVLSVSQRLVQTTTLIIPASLSVHTKYVMQRFSTVGH